MKGLPYKWIVTIVMIFGIFMSILDTTIINIAVPRLQSVFGASLSDVDWVATGYTLAEGVGTPLMPFFTTFLGTRRFYLAILALFTISSMFCGLAGSLGMLVAFRIVQGLAGSCLLPLGLSTIFSVFPPNERGAAMGVMGVPILLAPALGPTIGGYIVTYASWQLIFYINLPIGIVGFIMATLYLEDSPTQRGQFFDAPGFLFSSIGLASLLYAFDSAGSDGWGSAKVQTFLIIGVAALLVFVLVELLTINNGKQPLLDIRLFAIPSFTGANIANIMSMFGLYGGLYLLPIYLQSLRGQTAYEAGVILLPQAFASMVASLIGGILVDKVGTKWIVIPGLAALSLSTWYFSRLTLQTPFAFFQILLVVRGFTTGLAVQPLNNAPLAELKPRQVSQGSTISSALRSVASAFAVAIMTTLVSTRTHFHYAHLAEQITVGSPGGSLVQQLAAYFMTQGYNAQNAMTAALSSVYNILQQQSYMLSINDAFFITMSTTIACIFVVWIFVRDPNKKKSVARKEHSSEIGTVAEEEVAEPVFMH